jgi:hypothetical protein
LDALNNLSMNEEKAMVILPVQALQVKYLAVHPQPCCAVTAERRWD